MKIKLTVVTVILLLFAVQAQTAPGYTHPRAGHQAPQQTSGPAEVLREGVMKLVTFMRQQERPNPQMIAAFVESEIAPYFDFAYMAQWAAGPAYRSMNQKQRLILEDRIKTKLLSTLSTRLGSYDNQDVRFFRPRQVGPNEVKARVGILQAGGYPAKIDFRFYRSDTGWKIFDVTANGTSALAHYRQYFTRLVRQQGGELFYRR